jgi:hypothetical protein
VSTKFPDFSAERTVIYRAHAAARGKMRESEYWGEAAGDLLRNIHLGANFSAAE